MNRFCYAIVCGILLLTTACNSIVKERVEGNGKISSENRTMKGVSRLTVTGAMNVVVKNGLEEMKIETDENLIPYVVTETNGDELVIKSRKDVNLKPTKAITVYLSLPTLTDIRVTGSGSVLSEEKFSSPGKMSFDIAGSGNIKMVLNAPEVKAEIAGSGNLELSGETRDVKASIAGSGNFNSAGLKAEDVQISVAGSGDATVFADAKLEANLTGSGTVRYTGNATVEKHVAGSGEVIKMQ